MNQIFLPGYSQVLGKNLFDTEKHWGKIVETVRYLRNKIVTPIDCVPDLFEEYHFKEFAQVPKIIGIVENSPAALASIKVNSQILNINGIDIISRGHASTLLMQSAQLNRVKLKIALNSEIKTLILSNQSDKTKYPYHINPWAPYGIHLGMSIEHSIIINAINIIKQNNAQKVVLLLSKITKPFIKKMLKSYNIPGVNIYLEIVPNNFYGGNIITGAMLTSIDCIEFLSEWICRNGKPDLVLIPSMPFGNRSNKGWNRDITGKSYKEISRKLDIRVELIEHDNLVNF